MRTELPRIEQQSDDVQRQLASFGARLRELRLQRGLTLQQLADRSGLSRAFLSRLESGGRQASISAALRLSQIFRVSLASLFESPATLPLCTIIRSGDVVEKTVNGLTYAPLSDTGRLFNVQPLRVKVSPSRRGHEHYHHDGEEWVYVLHGKLTLSISGQTYDLDQGDAAHFESRLPHRLIARGTGEAEVLIVAAPSWNTLVSQHSKEPRSLAAAGRLSLPEGNPVPTPPSETPRKSQPKKSKTPA